MLKIIEIEPQGLQITTPQGWRSWLNNLVSRQEDLLHNHRPEGGEIYRYPLVQYHARGFRALAAGTDLLLKMLPLLEVETDLKISTQKHQVEMLESPRAYTLHRWQPFHSANYAIWNQMPQLNQRVAFLERILVGNILGFCDATGFKIPDKSLRVNLIENIDILGFQRFSTQNAELHRLTFTVHFEANINLPLGIGLGRGSSKGFGNVGIAKKSGRSNVQRKGLSVAV